MALGASAVLDKATQIRADQLSLEYDVLPVVPEYGYCHNCKSYHPRGLCRL